MKKTIIGAMLLVLATVSFSQQTNPTQPLTREDYLKKSKSQKITAFVLLGAGVTTLAIISKGNTSFDVLGTLAVAGTLSTLGSIPLFLASAKNKRKAQAASVYFKLEKQDIRQLSGITTYPSVAIKFNLH
jgi:hypothetical protein